MITTHGSLKPSSIRHNLLTAQHILLKFLNLHGNEMRLFLDQKQGGGGGEGGFKK